MLTGTPLDLTPFGPLLSALGVLYWLLALGLAGFALWIPGRWWIKVPVALLIVAGFVFPVFKHVKVQEQKFDEAKAKLDAATAHFEMRCKSAGEKIVRAVENVEGVVWMKWRDKRDVKDDYDQYKLFDPYGRDCDAEGCIEQLLRATQGLELDPEKKLPHHRGYRFVESQGIGGHLYKYTLRLYRPHDRDPKWLETLVRPELVSTRLERSSAGYGITWDDISTREDREQWVAGGSIKVIDLQTNEIVAERIGYMMDRGLGNSAGARSPWQAAPDWACPPFSRAPSGRAFRGNRSHRFIFAVLRTTEEK